MIAALCLRQDKAEVRPSTRAAKNSWRNLMENTPSTGKSLEYLIDRARRMALRYAQVSPYRLNPNRDIWEGIVRGLGRQAYTFGWPYCP
jgi:hypothetical protein